MVIVDLSNPAEVSEPADRTGEFIRAAVLPFRIHDSPSEVHRWAIAKRAMHAAHGSGKWHYQE